LTFQVNEKDVESYAVIGAAMAVHTPLGCGFLEAVYQEAMELELAARAVPFQREVPVPIFYRGTKLHTAYRVDYLCYGKLIVELKAIEKLTGVHQSQLLNYLRATGLGKGLLINFGAKSLEYKRMLNGAQQS